MNPPPPRYSGGGPFLRIAYLILGLACTAIGIAGVFLPVLPGTLFLIIALWAFSRSSRRFHDWLYTHPRLGPPLRSWAHYRVISRPAKISALVAMAGAVVIVAVTTQDPWIVAIVTLIMIGSGWYVATRPSRPPSLAEDDDSA